MGRGEVIQRHRRIKFCLACYLGLAWQEVFLYPFLLLSSSLLFHPTFSLLLHSMELNHCPTDLGRLWSSGWTLSYLWWG